MIASLSVGGESFSPPEVIRTRQVPQEAERQPISTGVLNSSQISMKVRPTLVVTTRPVSSKVIVMGDVVAIKVV